MENKPKSTYTKVIGILDIISGVIYTAIGFFYLQKWNMINPIDTIHYSTWESLVQAQQDSTTLSWRAIFLFIAAFTVICAGIAALFRRARAFVIVGSIVASLVILGIPAFILTIKYEDEFRSMNYRSRLVLAGILEIIGGGIIGFIGGYIVLIFAFIAAMPPHDQPTDLLIFIALLIFGLTLALAIFTIIGGVMAIKRRKWRLAHAASIIASFVLIGIPALILINKYKGEFTTHTTGTGGINRHDQHS